jgi:hypothetical protein
MADRRISTPEKNEPGITQVTPGAFGSAERALVTNYFRPDTNIPTPVNISSAKATGEALYHHGINNHIGGSHVKGK